MDISMFNVTLLLNVLKSPSNQSSPNINSDVQMTTTTSSYHQFDVRDYELTQSITSKFNILPAAQCPSYNQNQVRFLLYDRNHYDCYNLTAGNIADLKYTTYRVNKKTKIIVHGWTQDGASFGRGFVQAYFNAGKDYNVISVDWGRFSSCDYVYTVRNIVPMVGRTVGSFIEELLNYGSRPYDIHMIGHSLGSQVAGFAGKYLKPITVFRITGLDPAGPGYDNQSAERRLASDDAYFIDIIHTSVGGYEAFVGSAIFRPNGGLQQPMCNSNDIICSHQMSFTYFIDSITYPYTYCASNCTSYADYNSYRCIGNDIEYMGEYASTRASGNYYLNTRNHSPYGFSC